MRAKKKKKKKKSTFFIFFQDDVPLELVVVEWNPPSDRPGVEFTLPKLPNIKIVRVIKVC